MPLILLFFLKNVFGHLIYLCLHKLSAGLAHSSKKKYLIVIFFENSLNFHKKHIHRTHVGKMVDILDYAGAAG